MFWIVIFIIVLVLINFSSKKQEFADKKYDVSKKKHLEVKALADKSLGEKPNSTKRISYLREASRPQVHKKSFKKSNEPARKLTSHTKPDANK